MGASTSLDHGENMGKQLSRLLTANRAFAAALLLIAFYPFWIVADRWLAVYRHFRNFGTDSGYWVDLGTDTVVFGFACLLILGFLAFLNTRWSKRRKDILGIRLSTLALLVTAVTLVCLLVLVSLPGTAFRR
jgi:hypothetical protein